MKTMDVLQAVAIFLAIALIVFVISTVYFAFRCTTAYRDYYEQKTHIRQLQDDNKEILTDNVKLLSEIERLTAANDELKAINSELMNVEKVIEIEPYEEADEPTTSLKSKLEFITTSRLLPTGVHTNMFRCEGYQFAVGSQQAKLQEECQTDPETGIRYYTDSNGTKWNCAALAGAYGTMIGTGYIFTLKNGTTIPVILSDFKHPIDNVQSDDYGDKDVNYLGDDCLNVIEFVVDMMAIPQAVKQAGTMSVLNMFGGLYSYDGDIVSVAECGEVWEP